MGTIEKRAFDMLDNEKPRSLKTVGMFFGDMKGRPINALQRDIDLWLAGVDNCLTVRARDTLE